MVFGALKPCLDPWTLRDTYSDRMRVHRSVLGRASGLKLRVERLGAGFSPRDPKRPNVGHIYTLGPKVGS